MINHCNHRTWKLMALFVLAVSSTSCETVVDVDLPSHPSQLVVNGFFTPSSTWEVHVSGSVGLTQDDVAPELEDATVEILDGSTVVATLAHTTRAFPPHNPVFTQKGIYRDGWQRPEAGKSYRIRASAPGYEPIEALSQAPLPMQILEHTFQDSVALLQRVNHPPVTVGELRIRFRDPPGEANYYLVMGKTTTQRGSVFGAGFSINKELEEAYFIKDGDDDPFDLNTLATANELAISSGILFDDALFDGETYELVVRFATEQASFAEQPAELQIDIATATEALFRY